MQAYLSVHDTHTFRNRHRLAHASSRMIHTHIRNRHARVRARSRKHTHTHTHTHTQPHSDTQVQAQDPAHINGTVDSDTRVHCASDTQVAYEEEDTCMSCVI